MKSKLILALLISGFVGSIAGIQNWRSVTRIDWMKLSGKDLDEAVRLTSDSLFPDTIVQSWPLVFYQHEPKTISYPFPTSWPPTKETGIWIAFASTHEAGLTKAYKISCNKIRAPHCDSSEASPDDYTFLYYPNGKRPMIYDPPPPTPLNIFPSIIFQILPNPISGYHVRIDTMRLPISDWLIESDTLIDHPGQRDLFNAIRERRLPSDAEKVRIKEYYAVDLFKEEFKNYKTLGPGQKEFIEWMISE